MDIESLLNSVPTPNAADMAARRQLARKYTLVFLRKGAVSREDEALNKRLHTTEIEEARALAEADPKVKAGYIIVEAIPWMAVPASTHPG